MNKKALFYPLCFLLIIAASWILRASVSVGGFSQKAPPPEWSISAFGDSVFQKETEKYLISKLGALKYLLIIKNDIYEILNAGQFHTGYSGNITQGKNGILFERNYLICSWGYTSIAEIEKIAQETAKELKTLKELLAKRNIALMLVMAPSKVDFFSANTPWQYTARFPGQMIGSEIVGPIFEKYLKRDDILFTDCYAPLANAGELAFTDRGIHWSMYGAGVCLAQMARKLHAADPDVFPSLELIGSSATTKANYGENDLSDLLNIWPPYKKGRKIFYLAEFRKIDTPVSFVLLGDSFMGQLTANMDLSRYSRAHMLTNFENHQPSREEFLASLKHAKALILIANTTKFVQHYFDRHAALLIEYLKNGNK